MPEMAGPLKTGELLVKEGLIRLDDIDMALSIQEKKQDSLTLGKKRFLGMILCDLNLVTPVDNFYVLNKYNKFTSIQSVLVSKNIISKQVLLKTENGSHEQNIPFISFLLKKKLISTVKMQELLFELFHIPFRSISDFIFNKKDKKELSLVLDKQKALKNGIIPMVLKDNTILFGITDPENILFIRNLNDQFPQYRFKVLFIPFSGFSWFYKIIYDKTGQEVSPDKGALDIAKLLSFKTIIQDPEQQNESIKTLYERYELLRESAGKPRRDNMQNEFKEFILQTHKRITQEYKSRCIEFFLKKENQDIKIVAFPKR